MFRTIAGRVILYAGLIACLPVPVVGKTSAHSPGYFAFSPLARAAYNRILQLRFTEAQAAIGTLRREESDNYIAPLLENYLDFLTVLLDDDRAAYRRLSKRMEPRLARIAGGDRKSPYYLYSQAEIRLQWAFLAGKYSDYLSCLSDIKQAYALLEMNRREHPDFMPNLKSLGILHALVGNIPDEYQWAFRALSGMRGSIDQGMQELESVLTYAGQHDFEFEAEARVACAFIQLHLLNKKSAAWQTLQSGRLDPRSSPLAAFAMASLAMRTGRNDAAIRLLQACPSGADYYPFAYRDYLLGMAKLNRLDADANRPLETFVRTFKGANGIKEAHLKLAWCYLIRGDLNAYHTQIALVKTRGNDRSEPDKAALQEANSGEIPDIRLTKARLLFDGGYHQQAYNLLRGAAGFYTQPGKHRLEYAYRLGRITHALGDSGDAIRYYNQAIEAGAKMPGYFACNAALQLGLLYEEQGDPARARQAFKRCLAIHPAAYAASLHAKAKAGLSRLP